MEDLGRKDQGATAVRRSGNSDTALYIAFWFKLKGLIFGRFAMALGSGLGSGAGYPGVGSEQVAQSLSDRVANLGQALS